MTSVTIITAEDRRRLWHPRGTLCAVCRQPSRGFGWFDPHRSKRPRPSVWFCSMPCQNYWWQLARGSSAMVDLTDEERAAVTATMKRLALLMDEIGWQTRFADLSEPQVRAVIEEAVEGFREAMADIAKTKSPEVPF
jgi:hypothetical protein